MRNSKNLYVFNFAILLKFQKSDARKIYRFYSSYLQSNLNLLNDTVKMCFNVQ